MYSIVQYVLQSLVQYNTIQYNTDSQLALLLPATLYDSGCKILTGTEQLVRILLLQDS